MVASRESTTCIVRVVSSTRLRNATLRPSGRRAVRSSWAIYASAAERSRCTCPPVDVPVLVIGTLGRRRYGIGRIGVRLTRRGRGGRPGGRRLAAPGVGPGDPAGQSGGSPLARRPPEVGMPKPRSLPQLATRVGVAAAVALSSSALWAVSSTESERSEEHTSELQSRQYLVCRLLLEKKKPLPRGLLHLPRPAFTR